MMQQHFRDVHLLDSVVVPKEGKYDQCKWCGMQVNPLYPCHRFLKECQVGVKQNQQWEAAVTLTLALHQQFSVAREFLKRVEVFKYLGHLLTQNNDNIQAIHAQLWKACATWARVSQVLCNKNVSPHITATFHKAVTRVLSRTALAHLEGFHICATYRMAKMHKPKRGPGRTWIYPQSVDVLQECGLKTNGGVHKYQTADNCGVRGDPPDPH
jgi:hypothetical protein